jgi:hypothetical protein
MNFRMTSFWRAKSVTQPPTSTTLSLLGIELSGEGS